MDQRRGHRTGRGAPPAGPPRPPRTRHRLPTDHVTRFRLAWRIDDARVRGDAASDGCWPLITNDRAMTDAECFAAYHYQPGVEGRHHVLKGVLLIAPVWLKSEFRIDALGFCFYVALLVHALIERECRRAMTVADIPALPLYPEARESSAPTAIRLLDSFAECVRTLLTVDGRVVKTMPPELSPLQRQILDLLGVPVRDYTRIS